MKQKIVLSSLFIVFFAISFISAATFSITSTTPNSLKKGTTQTSFIVTNRGPENVNLVISIPPTISDGAGHELSITSLSPLVYNNLSVNQNTGTITLSYSGDTTNFNIGEFSQNINIRAEEVGNASNTMTLTVPLKFTNSFCKFGENASDLSIASVKISNSGSGEDTDWIPLDEITVKVKVENIGSEKVTSVYAELGLYDSKGKNIIGSMDNLNDKKISLGSISDGKEKTVEFKFKVPTDFKDDTYLLVVKTYKSGKEADICTSYASDLGRGYFETVTGSRESETTKQVVVDNIVLSPEGPMPCGEKVQVSADVVNIGDEDYPDQTKVTLVNKELGVNQEQIIREDLNQGDSSNVNFEFDVPKNVAEKVYTLEFRTYYDYNSDDETYNEVSDKRFIKVFNVAGNCKPAEVPTTSKVQIINPELDPETPEAIAGKQVIIKATLKNPGTTEINTVISVSGNSAWSNLVSIDPQVLTLAPGASKDVSIVLAIDPAAEGDKKFSIKATYGSQTTEQEVSLPITKTSQVQMGSVGEHLKRNWFIYLIIIVNIILIIAIISVVRRMISPRRDFE